MLLETLRKRGKQPRQCVISSPEELRDYFEHFTENHKDLVEGSVCKLTDGRRRRHRDIENSVEIIDELNV